MKHASKLTSVIQEIIDRWEIPGLAVGVVRGSDIVYTKVFGVQSLETNRPVTPESIFCVASVSKPFVATAAMQLAELGKLELDTELIRYLPSLEMADERYQQITPRQLLSHTSGMPDLDEAEYLELWKHPEFDAGASARLVQSLKNKRLIANPGEEFGYSNIGYNILGSVITAVSGVSFEEYMKEKVLKPSNMRDSSFLLDDIPVDRLAVPHIRSPRIRTSPIYPYHRADNPSSSLHASILDMCQWCMMCLEQCRHGKDTILKPVGFDAMIKPTVGRGGMPIFQDMGLGWNIGDYKGAKTVGHLGGSAGLNSFLVIMPEKDLAVTLMFNAESQSIYRLLWACLDALVEEEPHAKTVSWMIPISQALADGGIEKANDCATRLREHENHEAYFVESSSLIMLAQQLMIGEESDLAIAVLGMNIDAFPEFSDTYILLARAYLSNGDIDRARSYLEEALRLDPGNTQTLEVLKGIRPTPH